MRSVGKPYDKHNMNIVYYDKEGSGDIMPSNA